ncbi:DUF7697 family protein [Sphingomonas hylomeconis]
MSGPDGAVTRPIGLDYSAVMMIGAARSADLEMLAEILPRVEAAIVNPADEEQPTNCGDE